MKKYKTLLSIEAESDLLSILEYIRRVSSVDQVQSIYKQIQKTCKKLASFPERGHIPAELEMLDIFSHREVIYLPYRIIYEIQENTVYIVAIFDGRRDIRSLMRRRLLKINA